MSVPRSCLLSAGFTRVEQTLFEGGFGDDVIFVLAPSDLTH